MVVGGGDLPNEGEIGRQQQWEGAARGGWETNESRGGEGGRDFPCQINSLL